MNNIEQIASELAESWINGNLTYVVKTIADQGTKKKSAYLAVLVYRALISDGTVQDLVTFRRLLGGD